jgi:hypothetical protein
LQRHFFRKKVKTGGLGGRILQTMATSKSSIGRWWAQDYPCTIETSKYIEEYAPRSEHTHGGVEVGVLILPPSQMKSLLQLLNEKVGKSNHKLIHKSVDGKLIMHLLPRCVEFIQREQNGLLQDFFTNGCSFHRGILSTATTSSGCWCELIIGWLLIFIFIFIYLYIYIYILIFLFIHTHRTFIQD